MSDSFTETTSVGWFSRIGGAIKGILVGMILVVIAFPVLFWNEGRAVKTRKGLTQGSKEFVSVGADKIDSANDGKLIHISGEATTSETLKDNTLNIDCSALALQRTVEMYQWEQESDNVKKKKIGGGMDTQITYTYQKIWAEGRIDSSKFKKPEGHSNPQAPISSQTWRASPINIGEFTLSPDLAQSLQDFSSLEIDPEAKLPEQIGGKKLTKQQNTIYLADDPQNPQIGDIRITFKKILPSVVSIVSQQKGNSFNSFKTESGTSINMLMMGEHTGASMFETAQENNKTMTWILRVVGFVIMFFGFNLIFKPLAVVADVLPIAGTIVGVGTGIVSFLLAAPFSLITIGFAWIFYRPLIGVPLLILAGVGLFFLVKKVISYRKSRA